MEMQEHVKNLSRKEEITEKSYCPICHGDWWKCSEENWEGYEFSRLRYRAERIWFLCAW